MIWLLNIVMYVVCPYTTEKKKNRRKYERWDQAARQLSRHLMCHHEGEFSAAIIDEMHMNLKVTLDQSQHWCMCACVCIYHITDHTTMTCSTIDLQFSLVSRMTHVRIFAGA